MQAQCARSQGAVSINERVQNGGQRRFLHEIRSGQRVNPDPVSLPTLRVCLTQSRYFERKHRHIDSVILTELRLGITVPAEGRRTGTAFDTGFLPSFLRGAFGG